MEYLDNSYSTEAWSHGRPVYKRLPYHGFQDNDPTDWVTSPIDTTLVDISTILQEWYKELHPDTCKVESLEYLAFILGVSEDWDVRWSEAIKRNYLRAVPDIYSHRGTLYAINRVLSILQLSSEVWTDGQLVMSFTLPGTFGTRLMRIYYRVGLDILRNSYQWLQIERVRRNWTPALIDSRLCFRHFYLGFSQFGEPMFRE